MGISEGLSRMSWKLSRTVLRGGVTGNGDALLGKGEKGDKQPYYITIPSNETFAFAGLWETWTDKESDVESVYKSCTIITTEAGDSIRELHNRMPVILNQKYYKKWLDAEIQDPKELEIILKDGVIQDMKYYPVSKFVNSVKNNDPNCIKPIE
jgi:putative SOS response-associated peptidase YedK